MCHDVTNKFVTCVTTRESECVLLAVIKEPIYCKTLKFRGMFFRELTISDNFAAI